MFAPKNMHKNIQLIPLFRWKQSGNNYQGYNRYRAISLMKIILYICENELINVASNKWMNIRNSIEREKQMIPLL